MKKIIARTDASGHIDNNIQLPPDSFIEIFIPVQNQDSKVKLTNRPHPAIAGVLKINCDLLKPAFDEDEMELD